MEFRILGPLEVVVDGERAAAARAQAAQAAGYTAAARERSRLRRSADRWLWAEEPSAAAALRQACRVCGRRSAREPATRDEPAGLRAPSGARSNSTSRFERLLERAGASDPTTAARTLRDALALWRGAPLADFAYDAFAQAAIARLEELRLRRLEARIDAELALGRARQSSASSRRSSANTRCASGCGAS